MYVIVFYCFYVVIDVRVCDCTALVAYSINNTLTVHSSVSISAEILWT